MEIVNYQIRGLVSQIHCIEWKTTGWMYLVRVRLTRKQTTSRPDKSWPEMWKHMFDASVRKEKQQRAIEKPKLDNARRLRGIYFIDPEDEEFKITTKKEYARRKLEIPMPAAFPCETSLCRRSRTSGEHTTKYACESKDLLTDIMKSGERMEKT